MPKAGATLKLVRTRQTVLGAVLVLLGAAPATAQSRGEPGINLVKLTNGTDNNSPPGPIVAVGSTVTFTYVLTNIGSGPVSNVSVRDDHGTPGVTADDFFATYISGDTNSNGKLDVTETWNFTGSGIATAGQYTNVGTASGMDGSTPVSDTDPDHHFGTPPGINLVKLTNGTDNNATPGPTVLVGSTVTFTYVVTNSGAVPLSNVGVRDDHGTPGNTADDFNAAFVSGDTNINGFLDVTETWTFTSSGVITLIATLGQYTNVGTASGTDGIAPVSDSDPDNHFGAAATQTPTATAMVTARATATETATQTETPTLTATATATATASATAMPPLSTSTSTPTGVLTLLLGLGGSFILMGTRRGHERS